MSGKNEIGGAENCRKTCRQVEVPSREEIAALNEMRTIKDSVRDLRKRLSNLSFSEESGDREEVERIERKMRQLKKEWKLWEKKREEAARERMILLGHEEP